MLDITKIKPLNGRVFIKILPEEKEITSGLIVYTPNTAKEKSNFAVVEALSPDSKLKLNVGDIIVFPLYSGVIFNTKPAIGSGEEPVEYRIIREEEILGTLNGTEG